MLLLFQIKSAQKAFVCTIALQPILALAMKYCKKKSRAEIEGKIGKLSIFWDQNKEEEMNEEIILKSSSHEGLVCSCEKQNIYEQFSQVFYIVGLEGFSNSH